MAKLYAQQNPTDTEGKYDATGGIAEMAMSGSAIQHDPNISEAKGGHSTAYQQNPIDTPGKYDSTLYTQAKYGSLCTTIGGGTTSIQAKYGASCTTPTDTGTYVQAKYGSLCTGTSFIQAKYGAVYTTVDLDITYAQVEENISKLKKAINTLRTTWDNETKANLNTINNSWAGDDCEEYTSKLSKMNGRVQNTISALELLKTTYEQARDKVKESQMASLTSITKLEG